MIGCGKLGLPCAEEMATKHNVTGYDVTPVTSNKITIADNLTDAILDKDIIFIAAPTPHDPLYDGKAPTSHLSPKDFDYSIVKDILTKVNDVVTKEQLVVLISTVLPGTVRRELISLIDNARFVYNPYLIAMGTVSWDMVNPEMVIIGTNDGSETGDARELTDFYKTIMQNDPRYVVGTWDEAEAIKIFYNTFISTKVGLVNMIQDVAQRQGNINVDVVTQALTESTMRILGPQYMTAGMGDGGACHPRDNIALRFMSQELDLGYDLFESIMLAREKQAENMATELLKYDLPVVIVGKAYKPRVPYTAGSASMLVGHYVEQEQTLYYYDPELNEYPPEDLGPAVYLLAHSNAVTYNISEEYDIKFAPNSIIVDPWRKQVPVEGCEVVHYGNTRIG